MKRLKNCLLLEENNTKTFKELYKGKIIRPSGTAGPPEEDSDSTFWYGELSVTIEHTNRRDFDKPTLLWKIPAEMLGISTYSTVIADYCYRQLTPYIDELNAEIFNRNKPRDETGWYYLTNLGGEILPRNTAYFSLEPAKTYVNRSGFLISYLPNSEVKPNRMCFCFRMQVQLTPKKVKKAIDMLCGDLPVAIRSYVEGFDHDLLEPVIALSNKQHELRKWLHDSDYCAFIANGSILPRDSKTGSKLENAVPFAAPFEDEVEACGLKGLGIRKGVTVITGGGYSGKSTVLDTISACIYDHVLGDGRELCVTDPSAVTIAAEDGRCIKNIDITPFIRWLPGGDTADFSTEHASGSTSQAANILEAIDSKSSLLLIDEDRSATNFMIRDDMMKELISREPIIPFTERVRELYAVCGVSTILVIGGSGEYLSVANKVLMMDEYLMYDVTDKAKKLAKATPGESCVPQVSCWHQTRIMTTENFSSYPLGTVHEKLSVSDVGYILIGDEKLDTRGIYGLICDEQRTAMGFMLRKLETRWNTPFEKRTSHEEIDIISLVDELYEALQTSGLDDVYYGNFSECERALALPRKIDFLALVYRMRLTKYHHNISQ